MQRLLNVIIWLLNSIPLIYKYSGNIKIINFISYIININIIIIIILINIISNAIIINVLLI
jgi:hypothetical protein